MLYHLVSLNDLLQHFMEMDAAVTEEPGGGERPRRYRVIPLRAESPRD